MSGNSSEGNDQAVTTSKKPSIPIGKAFSILTHIIRVSAPDISVSTFTRFIFAKNGNKERLATIKGMVATDPYALRELVHGIEGDYAAIDNGDAKAYIIRDFDLWIKCATQLGHGGDYIPALFFKCFKGAALNSQPSKYGECPFGNWDVYKVTEPHYMSRNRYKEQRKGIADLIKKHFEKYVGKRVEIGELMRLLVWDVYTYTSFGLQPSEATKRIFDVWYAHLPEFDYAVRMAGSRIPYEWSRELKEMVQEIEDWGNSVFNDRVNNIDQYKHQCDVLTDTILNHSDVSLDKSAGAIRAVYAGGMNNITSALCGVFIHNDLNNDTVYKYLKQKNKVDNVVKEGLRLYTSIPTFRNVREQDNIVIGGKKVPVGSDLIMSTYALGTDPRYWENPMEFDPDRFNGLKELGLLCHRGFAPLGAPSNLGGRQCAAKYLIITMMEVLLEKILMEYKITAEAGGYWEFKQYAGQCSYAGKCFVKVEKR